MDALKRVFKDLNIATDFRGWITAALSVCTSLFFLYTSYAGSFTTFVQRGMLLALTMPLIFLLIAGKRGNVLTRGIDYLFLVASPVPFIYIAMIQDQLIMRGGIPNAMDIFMGTAAVIIILEATRRKVGIALPIIAIILIAYGFLGPHMPGILQHRGLDPGTTVAALFLGEEGIFGIPVAVTADFIMIFILFGSFLHASGAGEFFIDLAKAMFGRMRGGPAKAAVIASGLMGTVSGSAVANVVTTGTFTIPLMKKTGYKPEVAGAVEAVASSGGQIMPPIMGAAAFIMADFLKVPYVEVIIAAAIPACLYYAALFFMVDLEAAKNGLTGLPRREMPDWKQTVLKSGYLLIPVFVLIFLLGFIKYSPQKAAVFTIALLLVISAFRRHTRINGEKLLKALITGALGGLEVAAVCACAGIVIGILMRTGLGLAMTGVLIEVSQGILPVLMVLTMITSTILGMGLPTSACYIIVAVLIAPAMVKMGVMPMAAHLFAFYYATLSAITPPVALAAYAGASIAKAPPMKTGLVAFGLGLTGFIIPFMFVYGTQLLMVGTAPQIILSCVTALIGTFSLAVSITGMLLVRLPLPLRAVTFASALLLIKPGGYTDIVGIIMLGLVFLMNYYSYRRQVSMTT